MKINIEDKSINPMNIANAKTAQKVDTSNLKIYSLKGLYSYLTRHTYRKYKNYCTIDKLADDICKQANNMWLDYSKHLCKTFGQNHELSAKFISEFWFDGRIEELYSNPNCSFMTIKFTMIQQIFRKEDYRIIGITAKLLEDMLTSQRKFIHCKLPFKNAFLMLPTNSKLNMKWVNVKVYDGSDDEFLDEELGNWLPVSMHAEHALGMPYGKEKNCIYTQALGKYDHTASDETKKLRRFNEDKLTKNRAFVILWWGCNNEGQFLSDWTCLDKLREDNVDEYRQRIESRHYLYKDDGINYTSLDEINNFVINFIGYLTDPSQIVYAPQPETVESTRKMKASEKLNLKSYTFLDVKPEVIIKKEPVGTHRSPEPHLRRGHYRRQRYGKGLELEKLIFIPELKVNELKEI